MSNRTTPIAERLHDSLLAQSVRENEIKRRLRETISIAGALRRADSPRQGQFVALLVELTGARRSIEVGTFLPTISSTSPRVHHRERRTP